MHSLSPGQKEGMINVFFAVTIAFTSCTSTSSAVDLGYMDVL
jgi:hypothetical protein